MAGPQRQRWQAVAALAPEYERPVRVQPLVGGERDLLDRPAVAIQTPHGLGRHGQRRGQHQRCLIAHAHPQSTRGPPMRHALGHTAMAHVQSLLRGFLQEGAGPCSPVLTGQDSVDRISQTCVETCDRLCPPRG